MSEDFERAKAAMADRYALSRVVGRGGMATVYLARDLKHDRQVAVKVLRPELASTLGADRFLREIEIAAQLNHPHVLPLLDSGDDSGVLHYVMPYVDGESLRSLMTREGPLALDFALTLTREVADALSYAHRQGVVHRDVKPENILLSEGHAVVADFGIAKAVSSAGGDQLTRTGFPVGTPGYMSPEQAAGNTQLDERTDVFSLACIVYEMLAGETPGWWPTDEAVRLGRFLDAPPAHRERLDRLPGAIEQALTKAMSMRAADRFDTPTDLADALVRSSRGGPKYPEPEARAIVQRAAEAELTRPTETGALSLGGLQQIGAQVGIPPERIREAAREIDRPAPATTKGGIFGISGRVDLERAIDCELPEEEFAEILEEIRNAMGEVGRLNPTLGKSFSWNSLSFQNSLEGSGRLTHVMVSIKGGKTRIRITEGPGHQHFALLGGAAGATAVVIGVVESLGVGSLGLAIAPVIGVIAGGSYLAARLIFRRLMARRERVLGALLDRLARHVAETGGPPPDRAVTEDASG